MGIIFYEEHFLVLPKRLNLGKSYTIWFRMYNPVMKTGNFHVLLQDPSGLGGIIVIDNTCRRMGAFTKDGDFIDSGVDLSQAKYNNKWLQFAMSYSQLSENTKLHFYLNGEEERTYDKQKIILPSTLQYIGNCRDYNEPFGIVCDLRIYRKFHEKKQIEKLYLCKK